MVMLAAGPAMADTGMPTTTSSSLPLCAQALTPPLYSANCAPGVANVSGAVTLTLPGVGTLSFTIKADGTIDTTGTPPKSTATGSNFTAGTPKVSSDGTHISVTFFNAATPTQTYTVKAKVSPPTSAGGAATVIAVAKPAGHQDDQNEAKESESESDDDGQSTSSTTLNLTSTGKDDNESSTGAQHEHQSGSQGSSKGGSHGDGGGD
jgi:hypothetical protein